jgi:hypothetical protein
MRSTVLVQYHFYSRWRLNLKTVPVVLALFFVVIRNYKFTTKIAGAMCDAWGFVFYSSTSMMNVSIEPYWT